MAARRCRHSGGRKGREGTGIELAEGRKTRPTGKQNSPALVACRRFWKQAEERDMSIPGQ
jgi:hypothetical protein